MKFLKKNKQKNKTCENLIFVCGPGLSDCARRHTFGGENFENRICCDTNSAVSKLQLGSSYRNIYGIPCLAQSFSSYFGILVEF